jgi:hypothetical protein
MSVLPRVAATPSPSQLGALIDGSTEAMLVIDAGRRVSWCNPAAVQVLGCQRGKPVDLVFDRLDAGTSAELGVALGQRPAVWQHEGRLADGQPLRLRQVPGQGGSRLLAALPLLDRPPSSRLAPAATSEVVRLMWYAPQPLMVQDELHRLVAANKALLQALGLPAAQVLGRDPIEFMPTEDRPGAEMARALAARSGEAVPPASADQTWRLRDALGRDRWFETAPRGVTADDGRPLTMSILIDVTAERLARAQIDRSVQELESWFDLSPVGMLVYDETGLVLRSNANFEALVGLTPVSLRDAAPDLCRLLAWEGQSLHPDLRVEAPALEVHATVRASDGRALRLRARLRASRSGADQVRVMAVVEDRSFEDERDLAQLEIGALMDTAGIGVATYEASRGWTQSRQSTSGKPASGLQPALQSIRRDQVEAGSMAEFDRLQQALRRGDRAQVRYEVRVPELGRRWLLTRVEPGELAGGRAALSVVTLDITEQEESHRRSEQLLRELSTILDGTSAGMAYLRGERLVRCNGRFEALLGLLPGLASGATLHELLGTHEAALQVARRALAEDGHFETEFCVGEHWLSLSVRRGGSTDEPEAVAVLTDVSRLKAQQAELEALVRERELMFSLSDVGIAYVRDGHIERANEAMAQLSGHVAQALAGLPLSDLFEDEMAYQRLWPEEDEQLRRDGRWHGERRLRHRDGKLTWVQVTKRRVDAHDAHAGLICSYVDIDERRHAEMHTKQAQASLQRIIETAPLAIAVFDAASGRVLRSNAMAGRFFGRSVETLLGQAPEAWSGPAEAEALRADLQAALERPDGLRRELQRPADDGLRTWDVRIVSTGSTDQPQLLLVASDVTEQRVAEQARFDAAVSQREMLVKEVHHRIKNNLQGVAGLLQQTALRRPEVATLISEVVGQVQAIAQVHGLQVGVTGPLRIRPLLEAVTGSVQRTFGRPIEIEVRGAPAHRFALPEAESIPIALTINELLTNAIKHSVGGPVTCRLECHDDEVAIRIANPGRLPDGFSLAQVPPGVSGLGLVRALLPRRSAALTLVQDGDRVRAEVVLHLPSFALLDPL